MTETHSTGVRGDSGPEVARLVASRVLDVPDFPKPGIVFKDLMPLFADGDGVPRGDRRDHRRTTGGTRFDVVAGIEARGFVIAAAIAYATGVGRGAGAQGRQAAPPGATRPPTPWSTARRPWRCTQDAFTAGQRVLVVDDVLATGGTAEATLGPGRAGRRHGGRLHACCWSWRSWAGASGWPRVRSMPC